MTGCCRNIFLFKAALEDIASGIRCTFCSFKRFSYISTGLSVEQYSSIGINHLFCEFFYLNSITIGFNNAGFHSLREANIFVSIEGGISCACNGKRNNFFDVKTTNSDISCFFLVIE